MNADQPVTVAMLERWAEDFVRQLRALSEPASQSPSPLPADIDCRGFVYDKRNVGYCANCGGTHEAQPSPSPVTPEMPALETVAVAKAFTAGLQAIRDGASSDEALDLVLGVMRETACRNCDAYPCRCDPGEYEPKPFPAPNVIFAGQARAVTMESYDALKAISEQREQILRDERDEARAQIIDANNSLFGSLGFFLSLDGGPTNPRHLSEAIEKLKAYGSEQWRRAESAEQSLSALRERISQHQQKPVAHMVTNPDGSTWPTKSPDSLDRPLYPLFPAFKE